MYFLGDEVGYRQPKTGVCYAFLRNECTRGENCRYNHISNEGNSNGFPMQSPPHYQQQPSGFCFAFQRGDCFRGEGCKYSHVMPMGGAPMGAPMGGGPGGMPMGVPPQMMMPHMGMMPSNQPPMDYMGGYSGYPPPGGGGVGGRKPCFAFQRGECMNGESCRFAHIPGNGGGGGGNFESRQRKPCFNYNRNGHCDRGDSCRFAHVLEGDMPGSDDGYNMMGGPSGGGGGGGGTVCFAFQRGTCTRGDSCRYPHIQPHTNPPMSVCAPIPSTAQVQANMAANGYDPSTGSYNNY